MTNHHDKTLARSSRKKSLSLTPSSPTLQVLEGRKGQARELGFYLRELIQCALPYRPPKGPLYQRQNGHLQLTLFGDPRYGIPYGQDRLLLLWLCSAFYALGQPADNQIRLRSASDIGRFLGQGNGGSQRRELRESFQRLFGATYLIENRRAGDEDFGERGLRLIDVARLWFHRDVKDDQRHPLRLWQNVIRLSAPFADVLRAGSVPIDLTLVRALRRKAPALDLYLFLAYRCYRLYREQKGEVALWAFGEGGLWHQLGSELDDQRYPRKARQLLRRWLAEVKAHWPLCPVELSDDGERILLRPDKALPVGASVQLPGVRKNPPVGLRSDEELDALPDLWLPPPRETPTSTSIADPRFENQPFPPDREPPPPTTPEEAP